VYICDRDGFQLSMWCYGCLLRNVLAALASRPAPATDTASAALLALAKEWRAQAEHMEQSSRHNRLFSNVWRAHANELEVALALASLPAPAAPVIVVQVPDGWRVAQWDGQRYVSCIGLPYPTERQANSDCALILARVQPAIESRLP